MKFFRIYFKHTAILGQVPKVEQFEKWLVIPCINIFEIKNVHIAIHVVLSTILRDYYPSVILLGGLLYTPMCFMRLYF